MEFRKCTSFKKAPSVSMAPLNFSLKVHAKAQFEELNRDPDRAIEADVDVDLRELYFLIMHFLSTGPCQRTSGQFWNELLEHQLLPRRYHAWYSRSGEFSGDANDDGISFPLSYDNVAERYSHIEKDHLVKLLKQLILSMSPCRSMVERTVPSAADVPTLLGIGPFSLLSGSRNKVNAQVKPLPAYLRWPHMQADQVRGLTLREIGGGFRKHHRAPSIRFACYAIAKPSTMVQKMQNIKKLRGHRDAVYCAIFDRSGRYVITGSDDRLVKIWSMETAFCLSSCRGHEGDITDLAVSSNNVLVASASNDCSIRVWRLADGLPISVLRGHKAAVTAIAFSPRPNSVYQLLSSSDDGTCRIWDARFSQCSPRIYLPKPIDAVYGKNNCPPSNGPSSSNAAQSHQILCCAYNSNGTIFVTGSSDTFARVWSACKPNTDDLEQPNHEIDVLAGHENDVNYVQFSGCSVASRSSTTDSVMEEKVPKFKNSWYSHDNIVTCSRDGSAIIWIPRSRRSHGKVGRWTRAYHLKVPPPPMPPQPPRGGPRQRLLPTPRGVNMIIWSLDNRFVLAAIMDCRICVWNAIDGSLVHSLTGHSESTYVLDVHPFNPRIAMSAGYDGKTIVWDIWEGTPIRIYEIGRFKLVDGKFSPDGTSIVLSDDVGQIYLLSTGQGESQEDAKYDQFFLGDYRPLIQDTQGNVLDQETQLLPHRRNMQDPLCDSSLIPYPEPYQSTYQRRRLGALGIEWRPSTIKFAVGTDIGLGQEYQVLPLADLDIVIDPLPEFIDAMYWEPENDAINEDNDSEYNVTEEYSSGDDQGSLSNRSSSDPECSEEDKFDGLRRSKRKKPRAKVDLMTTSGRRVKRRDMIEHDGTSSSRNKRSKWKNGRITSKRKSSKVQSLRSQRVSARNSTIFSSEIAEASMSEEEEEEEDEEDDESEYDSSESESLPQDSIIQSNEPVGDMQNVHRNYSKALLDESQDEVKSPKHLDSQPNVGNRKRLILKFSIRNPMKSVVSENSGTVCVNQANLTSSSSRPTGEPSKDNVIDLSLGDPRSSSANVTGLENSESHITKSRESKELKTVKDHLEKSADYKDGKIRWGESKMRSAKRMKSEDLMAMDSCTGFSITVDGLNENRSDVKDDDVKPSIDYGHPFLGSGIQNLGCNKAHREEEEFGTGGSEDRDSARNKEFFPREDADLPCNRSLSKGYKDCSGSDAELKENPMPKPTIVRIKSKKSSVVSKTPSRIKFINTRPPGGSDLTLEGTSCMEQNLILGEPEVDEVPERPSSVHAWGKSRRFRVDSEGYGGESNSKTRSRNHEGRTEFPEAASDAMCRTRSLTLRATSRETNDASHKFKESEGHISVGTSRSAVKSFKKASFDQPPSDQWTSTSTSAVRSRSTRNRGDDYDNEQSGVSGKELHDALRKSNWLLLTQQEVSYRYIPQLGDEVVYLRQGHQEYEKHSCSSLVIASSIPSMEIMKAVEVCSVENLEYATLPGSGESCCKLTLKFIDSSSGVCGETLEFTLPELIDFPDFVVERRWYDASIKRNWTPGDEFQAWWRSDKSENGGDWWHGVIISSKDHSSEFPGSPWQRYCVEYIEDSHEQHSPWELHELDCLWEQAPINSDNRDKMLSYLTRVQQSASRNEDKHGILKLKRVAQKSDFLNRFPVPLSLEIIQLRLENNYYRSLKAMGHDVSVMLTNAKNYFAKNTELLTRMTRLSDWFDRTYLKL